MSIFEYNGSAVVAMSGKNCVAIGCDKRLGFNTMQTVATDFQKVFKMNDRCFVGLAGLATDVQTVHSLLQFRMNLYNLQEEREMKPTVLANLVSSLLYSKRFSPWFVEPIVVGLDDASGSPMMMAFDLLGATCTAKDFVCNGTASEQLYGVCESFWKPDMEPEELFETISQCLLAGVDRDCVSGWGAVVYVLTPDSIISRQLKGRMD